MRLSLLHLTGLLGLLLAACAAPESTPAPAGPYVVVLGTAQDGANPQYELTSTEGLGHVVVGAEFQSDDAIDLL